MLHVLLNDDPWFLPKRYGYGAGLPCAWQGWALLGAYFAVVLCAGLAWPMQPGKVAAVIIPATLVLVALSRRHTRGGWKWRSGED